jgi:two-component system sensor histidine kinase RegB
MTDATDTQGAPTGAATPDRQAQPAPAGGGPRDALLPLAATAPSVRLRTLVNLRWLAVLGQTATVVGASLLLELSLELGLCFLAIGASVIANLLAMTLYPPSQRLSEQEALGFLLFDLFQLVALLFLTGGLNNPFALLIIAPVTISATTLSMRSTIKLAVLGAVALSILGVHHVPLRLHDGEVLALAPLHLLGSWVAILIGMLFLAGFAFRLTRETEQVSAALLATQTALAREQKLHDLGGVVAAAAHELGTPLATIKLVSSELADELDDALPERTELGEDARLIREQADRCRDILRSMGRAGKDDASVRSAPFETVVREAAEPHSDRGIEIVWSVEPDTHADPRQPHIRRTPEIVHGLRNLVQNAVDFARRRIWVDLRWSDARVHVRVIDDGPGYPPEVLGRLGDPFLRSRARERRTSYEGMGLGLFIAKTLLERTGASVGFDNGTPPYGPRPKARGGAIAEVTWHRAAIESRGGALGENRPHL